MLDRRLHAFRPDLADARLRGQVEAARFVTGAPARVATASAPLLREPRTGAAMDSQLLFGAAVRVFEQQHGWAWVQAEADDYVGYVESHCLGEAGPAPTHKVCAGQTIVLTDERQIAAPLHTLSLNAAVTVAAPGGRFHELASGGYVFAEHLVPAGHRENDWVAVAERLLGLPYLWGGCGHGGIDCSGLVQQALAACGVPSPRDSDQQAASVGEPVSLDPAAWRHGDLLYVPGHVLIARGSDSVIHATGFRWAVVIEARSAVLARLHTLGLTIAAVRRPILNQ